MARIASGRALAVAGLALFTASAPACDKILGIQVLNADGGVPSGDAGLGGAAPGDACSLEAAACAACIPCGEVIDVRIDDFGAPTSPAPPLVGTTAGADRSSVPAGVACSGATGPERVYAVRVAKDGFLTARLTREGTMFDSVLYARKGCCDPLDATTRCADSRKSAGDHGYTGGEVVSLKVAKDEVWYVFVDGAEGAAGSYTLELNLAPGAACQGEGWVPIALEPGSPMTLSGGTLEGPGVDRCFGGYPAGAGDLGEVVYELRAPASVAAFDLALHGDFDTVLYARSDCADTNTGTPGELACVDEDKSSGSEFIAALPNKGAPIYVFVDTNPSPTGEAYGRPLRYELTVTPK